MPKILITGGAGFVGSELVKSLVTEGFDDLTILDRKINKDSFVPFFDTVELVEADLFDRSILQRIESGDFNIVIHLAAIAVEGYAHLHPLDTYRVNVCGTYTILDSCLKAWKNDPQKGHAIICSSDKVYGECSGLPYDESDPVVAGSTYETSKVCSDIIAQSYYIAYGLPVCITRFGNVYGSTDVNESRLVPKTIRLLIQGQSPIIRKTTDDKEFTRDFVFIDDAVQGVIRVMKAMLNKNIKGEIFNISYGQKLTPSIIISKISKSLTDNRIISSAPEPKVEIFSNKNGYPEIKNQWVSNSKIKKIIGWAPEVSIDEGIRRMIKNFMN